MNLTTRRKLNRVMVNFERVLRKKNKIKINFFNIGCNNITFKKKTSQLNDSSYNKPIGMISIV